ncbi:MAG TPA: cation diffusion facilitator family transporter [Chitinophagaceae bacterium]|nr:cation diffusion facilitator family transporter [Chitinophagaceae bacterium]
MQSAIQNVKVQKAVAILSVLLLLIKIAAYYVTHSVAILTDALESIVNVVAGFIGLYSLFVAAKPRDLDHPYGHGKAEFLSAAIEGSMILSAGAIIVYSAVKNLVDPVTIHKLDTGIYLVAFTAIVNFLAGYLSFRKGRKNDSLVLVASGRHLMTDSYSTLGIIIGLVLIYFTGYIWIDSAVAIVFAAIIIVTGYRIVRQSIAGIMDEADGKLLRKMVHLLNAARRDNWIDLHNLRIIKYGSVLHLDCHLTVPWFLNVNQAHDEIEALGQLVKNGFGESMELFVHSDGCQPFSCRICSKEQCTERKHNFEQRIEWTLDNILQDQKHHL